MHVLNACLSYRLLTFALGLLDELVDEALIHRHASEDSGNDHKEHDHVSTPVIQTMTVVDSLGGFVISQLTLRIRRLLGCEGTEETRPSPGTSPACPEEDTAEKRARAR